MLLGLSVHNHIYLGQNVPTWNTWGSCCLVSADTAFLKLTAAIQARDPATRASSTYAMLLMPAHVRGHQLHVSLLAEDVCISRQMASCSPTLPWLRNMSNTHSNGHVHGRPCSRMHVSHLPGGRLNGDRHVACIAPMPSSASDTSQTPTHRTHRQAPYVSQAIPASVTMVCS